MGTIKSAVARVFFICVCFIILLRIGVWWSLQNGTPIFRLCKGKIFLLLFNFKPAHKNACFFFSVILTTAVLNLKIQI